MTHRFAAAPLLFVATSLFAQAPKPAAAPAASPAPTPITQDEKDQFHKAYTEYMEIQSQYLGQIVAKQQKISDLQAQMSAAKKELEDLQAKSNEDVRPKATAAEGMFRSLSAKCVAPKTFDRMTAECITPPPPDKK